MKSMINFTAKREKSKKYTLVGVMLFLISVAILSLGLIRIYYSAVARACETEIVRALSMVKLAQDQYYAEFNRYAGRDKLHSLTDDIGLELSEDDFYNMNYIDIRDLFISTNYPEADEFLVVWLGGDIDVYGFDSISMAMDHNGNLYRSEDGETHDWMPAFPHLKGLNEKNDQ